MKALFAVVLTMSISLLAVVTEARGDDQDFTARLSGYHEVHFIAGDPTAAPIVPPALRGAISTGATGTFEATIDQSGTVIDYVLHYEGLEANVTQSHIHFGQRRTVGGIVVWLCQTAGTPAPTSVAGVTPFCPGEREGTVSGTITAAQVLAVGGQGIAAGEFEELVRAIRAGAAYANVHSTTFTPGEIRGQIVKVNRRDR
jgi:hypothetical protein